MAKNIAQQVDETDEFADDTELEGSETTQDMDDGELDLGAIETPKPLERGWQRLTIVSAVPGMSKGNPNARPPTPPSRKIELRVKVEGGKYDGRNIFDTLSFAPGALPYTKQALTGLGIDPNARFVGGVAEIAETLLHTTAEGFVDVQAATAEYEARNRIRRWRAVKADSLEEALED
jgi:hypothetical protein